MTWSDIYRPYGLKPYKTLINNINLKNLIDWLINLSLLLIIWINLWINSYIINIITDKLSLVNSKKLVHINWIEIEIIKFKFKIFFFILKELNFVSTGFNSLANYIIL